MSNVCEKCYHCDFCAGATDHPEMECDGFVSADTVEIALSKNVAQKVKRQKKWIGHLMEQVATAKERIAGYEQIAKVHSAYISILLKKLGATEDNPIVITPAEVKEVPEQFEARATITKDGGFGLYVEDIGHRGDCDGVQAEITKFERKEESK